MQTRQIALFVILLTTLPGAVPAQTAATVVTLNAPAFLVRDGVTRALGAGAELREGDTVRTGERARVLLRLAEGSDVKLGANAEFALRELAMREDGVFGGFLDVLRGAFRFTTTLLSGRNQRDIQVRVATVTAGIRGTDLWGRSNDDSDLVCLIEGSVTVSHEDGTRASMDQPLSFFVAPRGQAPLPVAPVDPARLAEWAEETEPQAGAGLTDSGGDFVLHLQSLRERRFAEVLLTRLQQAGYAATIEQVEVAGVPWNRVSLTGLVSRADAESLATRLAADLGIEGAWVQRR